jgi:pimeloyl-ACP methyl ester carboxylesterase
MEHTMAVPGARLRYVTRGSGPVLLLVAGGHGDASKSQALAAHLADDYTVLTYDRRGLSGSITDAPARSLDEHAEDVARLLEAVNTEPVHVYGTSLGGLIALTLAARRPDLVDVVVTHEPPVLDLLPAPQRASATADLLSVEEAFVADGADEALRTFAEFADIDPSDREPDVELRARNRQEMTNFEFLVQHDLRLIRSHRFDLGGLRDSGARVVPAVGASSGHIWPHTCGTLLAEALGVGCEVLPGGHNGYVFRPRETAERLRQVFTRPRSPADGPATPRRTQVGRPG